MTRLLVLSCSAAKRHDPGLMSARERYDGPAFRLLRRAGPAGHLADVYILIVSAEYGLIDDERKIADYDRQMTRERAAELAPQVSVDLWRWLERSHPECRDVFVNLGQTYMLAITGFEGWCERHHIACTVAHGGIGQRLAQMKTWLDQAEA